ncbi:MAG: FAD-dependent monooxygenase [Actinomycetota bacterium]
MTDAVVVGAGIGGLATAALLQRLGCRTSVIEQRAESVGLGAGILLQPNGLAVLDALGAIDRLREGGTELRSLRLLDERLHVMGESRLPGGPSHGFGLVVSRHLLHQILLDIARSCGVEIHHDHRLTGVEGEVESPRPLVADEHRPAVDLLVGADGQGSVVRGHVDPEGTTPAAGRAYVRALVDWTCVEPLTGEYWTRRGIAGIFACGDDRSYWYCTATPAIERAMEKGDLGDLRKRVAAAHPPLIQAVNALADTDQARIDRVVDVQATKLYRGSTVLVGDAAHAMAPNLGQGANSALVDAGVLASELHRRSAVSEALAAYDTRRHEVVRKVQLDARRLARVSHFTRGRRLRNRAVRLLPRSVLTAGMRRSQQVDLAAFRHELSELPR